ncbi:MAG TPA: OmpA family protein [Turneriella sp.]|nr:OmpA family protein [Turneriella sp.]
MAPEKITPNTDNKSEQKKPSPIKQIFLVLLLLIFLAALFYFFTQRFQCNKAPTPTTTQTVPVVNPPHVPPITAELKNFIESTKLNFVAEKTTLTPQTEKTLDALAGRLNGQNLRLQITGHTLGPRALNQKISEERAAIVKSALVARGVDAKNIETKGVADSESIADNNTPAGRAQNRRVSFKGLE